MLRKFKNFETAYKKRTKLSDSDIEIIDGRYYHNAREWQEQSLDVSKDAKYFSLTAPMGSGKSTVITVDLHINLERNKNLLGVILTPNLDLISNYKYTTIIYKDQPIYINITDNNLLSSFEDETNVEKIHKFIENTKTELICHRILVCTYSSYIRFYKKYKKKCKNIKNLVVWIDEAHHLNNELKKLNYTKDKKIVEDPNELAKIINEKIEKNISVRTATATPYRGDGNFIINKKHQKKFKEFKHYYVDYFENDCKYIKGIRFHTLANEEETYFEILNNLIEQIFKSKKNSYLLINMPSVNSELCNNKLKDLKIIISKIEKLNTGVDLNVVELVTPSTQKHNLKKIREENRIAKKYSLSKSNNKKEEINKPKINIIIALNMFKEGSDYIPIDNVILIGNKLSITDYIQRVGRGFRDYPNKKIINVYHIIQGFRLGMTPIEKRNTVNCAINNLYTNLIFEEECNPRMKILHSLGKDKIGENIWTKTFGARAKNIKLEIIIKILKEKNCDVSIEEQWNIVEEVAFTILTKKYKIKDNVDDLVMSLKRLLLFKASNNFEIDYNLIDENNVSPFNDIIDYSSKMFDLKCIGDFQQALKNYRNIDDGLEDLIWYLSQFDYNVYRKTVPNYNKLTKRTKKRIRKTQIWVSNVKNLIKKDKKSLKLKNILTKITELSNQYPDILYWFGFKNRLHKMLEEYQKHVKENNSTVMCSKDDPEEKAFYFRVLKTFYRSYKYRDDLTPELEEIKGEIFDLSQIYNHLPILERFGLK